MSSEGGPGTAVAKSGSWSSQKGASPFPPKGAVDPTNGPVIFLKACTSKMVRVSFWFPFGFLLVSFWVPFGFAPSKRGFPQKGTPKWVRSPGDTHVLQLKAPTGSLLQGPPSPAAGTRKKARCLPGYTSSLPPVMLLSLLSWGVRGAGWGGVRGFILRLPQVCWSSTTRISTCKRPTFGSRPAGEALWLSLWNPDEDSSYNSCGSKCVLMSGFQLAPKSTDVCWIQDLIC